MLLSQIIQLGEMMDVKVGDITTRTKLQDMLGGERFVIFQPTHKCVPVIFNENESVRFTFYRSNGVYAFFAVLEERFTRENLRLCVFRPVSEVEKNQRRYGYRLPVILNISLKVITRDPEEKQLEILGKTINISEKGVLFSCFEPLARGTQASIQLKLERNDLLILNAEVLRCEPPIKKNEPYTVAVQFLNCTKQEQTHIGRYILKRQIFERKANEFEGQ